MHDWVAYDLLRTIELDDSLDHATEAIVHTGSNLFRTSEIVWRVRQVHSIMMAHLALDAWVHGRRNMASTETTSIYISMYTQTSWSAATSSCYKRHTRHFLPIKSLESSSTRP